MKQHTFIDSSQVKTIRYFKGSQLLEIDFTSGKTYQYYEVPETIYEKACSAESIGKYVNEYIKKVFTYTQMPF